VYLLEQAVIGLLAELGIEAARKNQAPGVYVEQAKIAALGVRIRRGCCYHGLSLNVNMDLLPFAGINPCGYPGLKVTQLSDFGVNLSVEGAALGLIPHIVKELGFTNYHMEDPRADRSRTRLEVA
jgi:lipoyl(octanoyl) transferase